MSSPSPSDRRPRWLVPAALILTVATGMSGLVYEVTWEKYLATLLGGHSEATSAVLGLFLGGLAVGYSLFGRVARALVERASRERRAPRLLLAYGAVEIGIGAYALAFPVLFRAALAVSALLPHEVELLAFTVDVLLCALLIVPPAVLMGGTIPMLTQALSTGTGDATRTHAFVYGFNTVGAFAGALAGGFYLIPTLGLPGTLRHVAVVNGLAGAGFAWMGRHGDSTVSELPSDERAPAIRGFGGYLTAALLLGFAMMTVQVVVIRIGALSFGSSQFTFSMVVAVFVLCIGLGSLAVSALRGIPTWVIAANPTVLAVLLCLLDPLLERAPYGAHVIRTRFSTDASDFYPYQLASFAAVLLAIGLPVLISGATLPLLFHRLRGEAPELGGTAGRLYGWNTLGSLLGALLGGYVLLFWLDLDGVYRVAIVALACCGGILAALSYPGAWLRAGLPAAAVAVVVALLPAWRADYLLSGLFRERAELPQTWEGPRALIEGRSALPFVFHVDDPIASIGVGEGRRHGELILRTIVTNGKSDGNTLGDYPTMGLLGTLPAWLALQAERAFVVGFGTGVTAAELASVDDMREVVVAEISPGVVEASPLFDFANMNASRNPRIRIERRDAYRSLLAQRGSFDVIVSEPSNPWVSGVEMLFSREFLAAARDRLRPGGVHCQWFHLYETDRATLGLVLRTMAAVFPRVAVWYGRGNDLLIVGFESADRELDPVALRARYARDDFRASFERAGVDSFEAVLAHELLPAGVIGAAGWSGPVHSLFDPRLGYAAGRGFFGGGNVRVPFTGAGALGEVGRRSSLWRRHVAGLRAGARPAAYERFAAEVCANRSPECVAILADWERIAPESPRRERLLTHLGQSVFTFGGPLRSGAYQKYREAFVQPGDGPLPLRDVERADRLFRRHYFHAAAPPPEALVSLWERCRDDDAQQCSKGLDRARRWSRAALQAESAAHTPRRAAH